MLTREQLSVIQALIDGGERTAAVEAKLGELKTLLTEIKVDMRQLEHNSLSGRGHRNDLATVLNKRRADEREVLKLIRKLDF